MLKIVNLQEIVFLTRKYSINVNIAGCVVSVQVDIKPALFRYHIGKIID